MVRKLLFNLGCRLSGAMLVKGGVYIGNLFIAALQSILLLGGLFQRCILIFFFQNIWENDSASEHWVETNHPPLGCPTKLVKG